MGQRIEITTADGTAEAYLTEPGAGPGVLLFVDAIGLRTQIEAMADRIASWGYVVLAPHVFYREGSAAELAPAGDLRDAGAREAFFAGGVMDRVGRLTPDLSNPDTEAYVDALLRHATAPIGVTGYCMGARLALRAAGLRPDVVRAVGGFHGGRLVTDAPDSPHLSAAGARAELVFGHADQDASMPPEQVAALAAALDEAGLVHAEAIYPGAPHGFTMADTSSYDEAGAERHFTELRGLLDRTLGQVVQTGA
ncbi:dienelactone hydrolase family protein [Nocardioides lianchengensis]|uniref:Carboxymethylenebutenolidase n=1 Tax=Nocardioides lianchengensis TaxID=1045774 RepID=A0A1G6JD08_9ACTN|nr:dienelactone hydrolase family protein [Nocardioides lianchengensis]NYG12780.1 carboxymethylenebutenolidase [Nocardioides lianchengensis]SDC16618.1 carboxymethylenebutenolidase [Nocardioides lianchengensis]